MKPDPRMKEPEARQIVEQFKQLCVKHNLWISVKEEHQPDLKWIRIEAISIKVEK